MFEEIAFYLILLVSCLICARAMASPGSSSSAQRLPPAKYQGTQDTALPAAPMEPLPKWHPFQLEASVIVCSCGQWNQPDGETCWSCDRTLTSARNETFTLDAAERCDVCSYWIYPGDRVGICPACKAQGHYAHVYEYVRAKGQCPRCSRKLVPTQLLSAITLHDQPVDLVVAESKSE